MQFTNILMYSHLVASDFSFSLIYEMKMVSYDLWFEDLIRNNMCQCTIQLFLLSFNNDALYFAREKYILFLNLQI